MSDAHPENIPSYVEVARDTDGTPEWVDLNDADLSSVEVTSEIIYAGEDQLAGKVASEVYCDPADLATKVYQAMEVMRRRPVQREDI